MKEFLDYLDILFSPRVSAPKGRENWDLQFIHVPRNQPRAVKASILSISSHYIVTINSDCIVNFCLGLASRLILNYTAA